MESSLLTILPNLSIGVIAVGALVYICIQFLKHLDTRDVRHAAERAENQKTLRELEREARTSLSNTLSQSNFALSENTKMMNRVVDVLDKR